MNDELMIQFFRLVVDLLAELVTVKLSEPHGQ